MATGHRSGALEPHSTGPEQTGRATKFNRVVLLSMNHWLEPARQFRRNTLAELRNSSSVCQRQTQPSRAVSEPWVDVEGAEVVLH